MMTLLSYNIHVSAVAIADSTSVRRDTNSSDRGIPLKEKV